MDKYFKLSSLFLAAGLVFALSACSQKSDKVQEFNKPALYWYNQMMDEISTGFLEDADDTYISLESEHRNSPLLSTALLVLADAHMSEEEYELANFYLDEYIKRFAYSKNIDYVRYLKIKANFMGFVYDLRDQQLVEDTITQIDEFRKTFPRSPYTPLVNTMSARLYMAKATLDKEIADLYERIDKPKASEYYNEKVKKSWVDPKEIEPVDTPFYRYPFEKNLF
ncbi:outer membrane protein assembly factor BamD [Halarcobacter ebronensis]|uniref:Outer membrane protein assembly factor BamD n=1 Tax=Halarcobacter ebronensis TaxID=1462615 RepID=A0A4Q0YC58_9BACT|nr:outer membrane protein assembly factor BamD [Halarcobacter ebronensis]QKF81263.1 beta-barrel assembly machinery complex, BamD/YfiO lipoprotein [Halarcobacter ebronensis]RXJ67623.1 outer membrane protein assembly factor BamD [Halarcobacter ebronensis]RXK04829.1 outer membrane protein assembly factor BamD [Halarcobacter ebronensis]